MFPESEDDTYYGRRTGLENVNVKNFLTEVAEVAVQARPYIGADQSLVRNAACFALRWGHDKVVALLIKHGLSMGKVLENGTTLLEVAIRFDRESVVRMLIDMGANPNQLHPVWDMEDNSDMPLELACFLGHAKVARVLLEKGASRAFAVRPYYLRRIRVAWTILDSIDTFQKRCLNGSNSATY